MANDRTAIIGKTRDMLRSIRNLDEFKAHKAEVLDLLEAGFKSAVEMLRKSFDSMLKLTPEQQQEQVGKFADDTFLMDPEIGKEMDRIAELPGAAAYIESFKGEMQMRIEPYLEEFTAQMGRLMEQFMGGLMGGIADAVGGAMAGAQPGDPSAPVQPEGAKPRPVRSKGKPRGKSKPSTGKKKST
jgi:hypothetical protein